MILIVQDSFMMCPRQIGSSRILSSTLGSANVSSQGGSLPAFGNHIHQWSTEKQVLSLGPSFSAVMGYRIPSIYKLGNLVLLEGTVSNSTTANTRILTIPSEYIPSASILPLWFVCSGYSSTTGDNEAILELNFSGELRIKDNFVLFDYLTLNPIYYVQR